MEHFTTEQLLAAAQTVAREKSAGFAIVIDPADRAHLGIARYLPIRPSLNPIVGLPLPRRA